MELDGLGKVSAIAASLGAFVGSLMTWAWKFYQQSDRITVRYGTAVYEDSPDYGLHVISRRDHKMEITDYGFILLNGKQLSIPYLHTQNYGEDDPFGFVSGSRVLQNRNDRYEETISLWHSNIVGAYAETSTQKHPTIGFSPWDQVSFLDRFRIRLKLYIKPELF